MIATLGIRFRKVVQGMREGVFAAARIGKVS
jgi:hypothetical protein